MRSLSVTEPTSCGVAATHSALSNTQSEILFCTQNALMLTFILVPVANTSDELAILC